MSDAHGSVDIRISRRSLTLDPKVAERAAAEPKTMSTAVIKGLRSLEACWLENSWETAEIAICSLQGTINLCLPDFTGLTPQMHVGNWVFRMGQLLFSNQPCMPLFEYRISRIQIRLTG